jgi:DNA-directed RNA polymerase beta subunit
LPSVVINKSVCLCQPIQERNKCHREPTERINFGKIKEVISPPNLIELQTNSYLEFLQLDIAPSRAETSAPGGL